ncbi:Sodium-coupled monocarboxylate transporter 2, partial [Orchesella cincta]
MIYSLFIGLFIAGLTCASMSSLSSGLTALASITTYDYVSKLFPNLSDTKLSRISKINTLLLGMVSYCFVFVIQNMGSILPATSSFLGIMLGPTLGIFTLGMMVPFANAKGSLGGMIGTFVIMITYVILNNVFSSDLPDQKLPLSVTGCPDRTNVSLNDFHSNFLESSKSQAEWKNNDDSSLIQFLSISYMWYSAMGCVLAVILGLLLSLLFKFLGDEAPRVPSKCLSPPVLNLLLRYFPTQMEIWIDLTDTVQRKSSSKSDS